MKHDLLREDLQFWEMCNLGYNTELGLKVIVQEKTTNPHGGFCADCTLPFNTMIIIYVTNIFFLFLINTK